MQKMQSTNLKTEYKETIRPKLKGDLKKENIYQVPSIQKIVINSGFGKAALDQKAQEQVAEHLKRITGQTPIFTKAKKAIAGFKLREGQVIGAKVTLRDKKMYDFFVKIVSVVLPRLRDFRGVSEKAFDGQGNYTLGFSEINVFPEIEYTRSDRSLGLQVTISTNAKNDEEAQTLLKELGMPFRKIDQEGRQK